jgi:hypothetical protein
VFEKSNAANPEPPDDGFGRGVPHCNEFVDFETTPRMRRLARPDDPGKSSGSEGMATTAGRPERKTTKLGRIRAGADQGSLKIEGKMIGVFCVNLIKPAIDVVDSIETIGEPSAEITVCLAV